MKKLLITFVLSLYSIVYLQADISVSEYNDLQTFFQSLHGSTTLPVQAMTFDDIESAFGPRHQTSTDRYDFHRGIDVDGTQGDNILAVADGVFWEYREFSAGGHTVILRHDFDTTKTINGRSYDHYFTYYMHLWDDEEDNLLSTDYVIEGWTEEKFSSGNGTQITAGQHIGEMGNSGSSGGLPYADHLHWEVRVGTTNSLIFQTDNPGTTQHGFDPHMNPMLFFDSYTFGDPDYDPTLEGVSDYNAISDLVVLYSTNDEQPLLNRIEVTIVDVSDDSEVKSHVLDYNLRTGFDATDIDELDRQIKSLPYIEPLEYGDTAITFSTEIIIPELWLDEYANEDYRIDVNVFDIWDNETANTFAIVPEPEAFSGLAGIVMIVLFLLRKRSS